MFLPNTLVHDLRRPCPIGVGKVAKLTGFRFPTGSASAEDTTWARVAKITFNRFTVHPGDDVAAKTTSSGSPLPAEGLLYQTLIYAAAHLTIPEILTMAVTSFGRTLDRFRR